MSHSAQPSIAVDLFLTLLFALVCRWIKRNPSSFLRYALFPIGGSKVERWPRFMLVIARACGIVGFFALLLTFVGLVIPDSVAPATPAVLFTKYAVCILISFFALRGTAEPVLDYEVPKFNAASAKPYAALQTASAPPASIPARAKSVALASPPMAGIVPARPGSLPTIWPGPANPTSTAFASTSHSAQNRLSDLPAPPVPNRTYPLSEPPPGVVKQRLVTMASVFVMAAILVGLFYLLGITWLAVAFLCFFSFAELVLFLARNAPVGTCPFCGGLIQRYNRLRAEPVRCDRCGEISKFENERLSPYDPNAVAEKPIFRSLVFENAVWPNGCVQCGAHPTRFDQAQAVRYQVRRLATPLASAIILPHPAARVTGVPYCQRHAEAIEVIPPKEMFAWTPWKYLPGFAERMEERREAFLMWRSLPMMRRYLEANRRAKSAVSAGYREPNLLQKMVSGAFTKSKPRGPGAANPPPNPYKSSN